MRDGFKGLSPIQPQVSTVFMRERHRHLVGFGNVPVDLLSLAFAFVLEGVLRSLFKTIQEGGVLDTRLFGQFPPHRCVTVGVIGFDMTFWEIPVALRILQQENGSIIDKHHAAGGLHGWCVSYLVHGHNGALPPNVQREATIR